MTLADIITHLALFPTRLPFLGTSHQYMRTSGRLVGRLGAFGVVMDLGLELVETIHERHIVSLLATVGTPIRMMVCWF
jgi:hypothetical protein